MVDTDRRANRNRVMGVVAVIAAGLLATAAAGTYRLFSYLAVGLLVGSVAAASIERNERELDVAPYNGLVVGWTALFAVGFTAIWLLWNPDVTTYTYVLGLPTPTLVYVVCIWLLPILGAFYYAAVFGEIGDEDVVAGIMADAREVQRGRNVPLGGELQADGRPDGGASGGTAGGESTRGGESRTETESSEGGER